LETQNATAAINAEDINLESMIPPAFFEQEYVSRTIDGVLDMDIIDNARRLLKNVLIEGPTGSAKTSLVYAAAARAGLPVVNIACNGASDPKQFIGGWAPQPDGTFDFMIGDLVKAVIGGGIIYLDEVNMCPPKIAVYLHSLLDRRRSISIPEAAGSSVPTEIIAHPDCQIVGSMNPNYHGTRPLNQAFRNRFNFKIRFPYSEEVEEKLVQSKALLSFANTLRLRQEVGDLSTPISTSALMDFEEIAQDEGLGYEFAITNFINSFSDDEVPVITELFRLEKDNIGHDLFVDYVSESQTDSGTDNPQNEEPL